MMCWVTRLPSRFDSRNEIRVGQEMIIFAFDFTGARRSGCAGNGVDKVRRLPQCVAQCRLASARWGGDNE